MKISAVVKPIVGTIALSIVVGFAGSARSSTTRPEAAWVVLGPDGEAVARVVTDAAVCPKITIGKVTRPMKLRAPAAIEPLRPTASKSDLTKPSAFPVRTCEAQLPTGTRSATIDGKRLPLPKPEAKRIVVIGDTGCRLKAADDAWQACNDPAAYPFAEIARAAAAWKPDLVIHVGDYLYRENPCPAGNTGCAGSPWGYGWDSWDADFFAPGETLLEAAPWVMVRGNHENCARAGQGWWRMLEPRPLEPGRDCNDPANDARGDWSPAYAVPLGDGAQVVVMDLSKAGSTPFMPGDPRIAQFAATWGQLDALSHKAVFTFAADHYPPLGIGGSSDENEVKLFAGNRAIEDAFGAVDPAIMPKGVDVLLAGHIHDWEQVDLGGKQPSQFIAGFSGTQEDAVPLPAQLSADLTPVAGVAIEQFNAIVDKFGFMTLERTGKQSWRAEIHGMNGKVLRRCTIEGRRSDCRAG